MNIAHLNELAPRMFVQHHTAENTMLYALAVGLGEANDPRQLDFVHEANLRALPTMGLILGDPGFWLQNPASGIDWVQVLYGEVSIELHAVLPVCANVSSATRVDAAVDKGLGKGALLYTTREVADRDSGQLLCTVKSTYICRADGGFEGASGASRTPHMILPTRPADECLTSTTHANAALLYRLTGDRNPLHADPKAARKAGFQRPILHGMCTLGMAGHALLRSVCEYQSERVLSIGARFLAPVYPGDSLQTEIWHTGIGEALFRCVVPGRGVIVLSGIFRYARSVPFDLQESAHEAITAYP